MDDKPVELYLIGGVTGFLAGIVMLVSRYLVMFRVHAAYSGTPEQQMAFIANQPLVGITHGLDVVSLILIVPAVVALFVLLNTVVTARSFLGLAFATVWIIIELVGHLAQTAPLRALSGLYTDVATRETAMSIYLVSEEFWEALSLTGAFFFCLTALCYGLALIDGWNRSGGYLFFLAILAFPIGMMISGVSIQLHIALRGLAFCIVGGILIRVALSTED